MSKQNTEGNRQVELAEERTELAAARTRDAVERTLMAWIRTTLSMISFGFGLYKVLQYMMAAKNGAAPAHVGSDILAVSLIALGTVLLVVAIVQYRQAMRDLERQYPVQARLPLPMIGAAGVALVGVFALVELLLG